MRSMAAFSSKSVHHGPHRAAKNSLLPDLWNLLAKYSENASSRLGVQAGQRHGNLVI